MVVGYFIALVILVVPLLIVLQMNLSIKPMPKIKIYSKELIKEFERFEEMLKAAKRMSVDGVDCVLDEKDNRYMFVNGNRMELNIENYKNHVIG